MNDWKQNQRNKDSFRTGDLVVEGIKMHDTITANDQGNIRKPHTSMRPKNDKDDKNKKRTNWEWSNG